MLISIRLLSTIPNMLGIVKSFYLKVQMVTVKWRLKQLLECEGMTQYQLMKLTQGRVSKNTIGSAVRNELSGVQFSTLAVIIEVLESHLDRRLSINELIEVERDAHDE